MCASHVSCNPLMCAPETGPGRNMIFSCQQWGWSKSPGQIYQGSCLHEMSAHNPPTYSKLCSRRQGKTTRWINSTSQPGHAVKCHNPTRNGTTSSSTCSKTHPATNLQFKHHHHISTATNYTTLHKHQNNPLDYTTSSSSAAARLA